MLEEGVIVALGSDFNPNAYCFSMVITSKILYFLNRVNGGIHKCLKFSFVVKTYLKI